MARLRGTGLGMGIALGTAAIVRASRGVALAPEPPENVARQIALGKLAEKPDVIVVAVDYQKALAVADTLDWARVVGVAAESDVGETAVPEFPAVVGVTGLMSAAGEGGLILLDAERGIVIADPDGLDIAAYQQERTNLSPRKTLYLDAEHQPAQTLDGRTVQVVAIVENTEDMDRALEQGADGLYIPFDTLLPAVASETKIRSRLLKLIERAAGKPLFLSDDYALPLLTVLESATRADITLAVPPRDELPGLGIAELRQELDAGLEECFQNDTACALPRLAANLTEVLDSALPYKEAPLEQLASSGVTRLMFAFDHERPNLEPLLPALEEMFGTATENLISTYIRLLDYNIEDFTQEKGLQMLVGAGVTGILTRNVAQVKTWVRGLHYAECQEIYLRTMQAAGVNG